MKFGMKDFRTSHDPMCLGAVSWGYCDCDAIQRIREDERSRTPSSDEAYANGYEHGRKDAAKAVKKRLKGFKKSFRKSVVSTAKGN